MNNILKTKFRINAMPFYWRVKNNISDSSGIPDYLSFELDYDSSLRLVIQKRNKIILHWLEAIYKKLPNIGNIQEYGHMSESYKNDLLKFILRYEPKIHKTSKVLEIGCGGCLILKDLHSIGFDVLGVDPSPYALKCGKKLGIDVIQDFFPSSRINQRFNLIFHSDVIEHMAEPLTFLKAIHRQLQDDGVLIIAIPDSNQSLKNGDISIFLHQHLNYFDPESLKHTVQAAGFGSIIIEKAGFGGSIYCRAIKKKNHIMYHYRSSISQDTKYLNFINKIIKLIRKLKYDIDNILSDKNRTLGFYAPIRTLPYLGLWGLRSGFRFFDDSDSLHNKYLDGVDVLIENFDDLKRKPVTDIFIMSPSFGNIIKKRIIDKLGKKIHIRKLTDYYQI